MRFTESHEWIKLQGKTGIVGITHHAQKELGDIVFVELPKVGAKVKKGDEVCVLESTKAAADVYAPVSGKITAVNEALKKGPSFINQSAESDGWLFQIEVENPSEVEKLLSRSEYETLIS